MLRIVEERIDPAANGEALQFLAAILVHNQNAAAHRGIAATHIEQMMRCVERERHVGPAALERPARDELARGKVHDIECILLGEIDIQPAARRIHNHCFESRRVHTNVRELRFLSHINDGEMRTELSKEE